MAGVADGECDGALPKRVLNRLGIKSYIWALGIKRTSEIFAGHGIRGEGGAFRI